MIASFENGGIVPKAANGNILGGPTTMGDHTLFYGNGGEMILNTRQQANLFRLIDNGYKYICTQNSKSKMELWARFNGYKDTIVYLYYIPETDMVLEQTRQTVPYTQLDMMAQMRDKMREDFLKLDVEYDKEKIWQ